MSYISPSSIELIRRWCERSQGSLAGEFTMFDKFISLWFSFNGWGSVTAKTNNDGDMVKKLKLDKVLIRLYSDLLTKDTLFRADVERLAKFRILDMRYPNEPKKGKTITDVKDFSQILAAIYQVRCNLFHGQKDPIDSHDKELVELSYRILSKAFKPIVEHL
jgi:hypothetical protein